MSALSQTDTALTYRKAAVVAVVFCAVSIAVPVLLWPTGGSGKDDLLRVFLIGWGLCGVFLAATLTLPAFRAGTRARRSALLLGLGLLLGLALGSMPWMELVGGPLWQVWLTLVMASGYVQQLRRTV